MIGMLPLLRLAGLGHRKRLGRRRVKRVGGRKMRYMIQGSGHHVRRRVRHMRGRGIFDTIKNLGSKALSLARSVPIVSTGLSLAGKDDWAKGAKALGFGRRRRYGGRVGTARRAYRVKRRYRKRRYGGRMSVYGGRSRKRRFSAYGGRKRKVRRTGRAMTGRGILSGLISGLLGGRKRVRRTRRVRRTYPTGMFN